MLDAAGVPYCRGGVMAQERAWRRNAADWRAAVRAWVEHPRPEALLSVDIFYDMHPVAGDGALAGALHRDALAAAAGSIPFPKVLAKDL